MRSAAFIRVELPRTRRIELLKDEYAHFLADGKTLTALLLRLVPLHGKKRVERWTDAAKSGDWDMLVAELLDLHYDPMYARSIDRNFPRIAEAPAVAPEAIDRDFRALARELDAQDRLHNTA